MGNKKSETALLKKVWDIANVLSAAGVWVDDFVRWKIFGEGKKLRNIKTARSLEQF